MHALLYTIELLEPVLANSLGGDANSAQSLKYVPGSLIRGAVIERYRRQFSATIDAGDEETRRLFFEGRTRYLHAYPATRDNQRTLPAPLAWHKRKNPESGESSEQRNVIDLSINPEKRESNQLIGLGEERFCVLNGEIAHWFEVGEQLNVHTQRDAVIGRAKEDVGAVFRYEALPVGLKLKGVVITESEEDADIIKGLLDGQTIRLGKSRTAGYGAARIVVDKDFLEIWQEADNPVVGSDDSSNHTAGSSDGDGYESDGTDYESYDTEAGAPAETPTQKTYGEFILIILSDAIVRDDNGEHTLDPLPALRRKLGERFTLKLDEERSFHKAEIVGGFNRKWGLPLPQVVAIAAGSTFFLKVEGEPIPLDLLREWQHRLQEEGLGERRVDGCGRVVIEWYYNQPRYWKKADQDQLPSAPTQSQTRTLTEPERKLAEQMLRRLLRRDLDQKLAQAAHRLTPKDDLPNSQLSRWRSVIYSALGEANAARKIGRVTEFMNREEEKGSPAWEKLRRTRMRAIGAEHLRLTDWIRETLTKEDSPWYWLTNDWNPETKESPSLRRSLGKVMNQGREETIITVKPTAEMAVEYRLRLIDAVLALAAKQRGGSDA
jgi:CRISPR-associated protein Csx10